MKDKDITNKRIILKLSGEALYDSSSNSIFDKNKLDKIVSLIDEFIKNNVKVGVVIGAGNIFRGRIATNVGLKEEEGDYLGMVGTVINCKALSYLLAKANVSNKIYSSLEVEEVAPKYDKKEAKEYYDKGYVIIFGGGVGKVKHTTDTCAALRALEMDAKLILAAKNGVDGVYTKDPNKYSDAVFIKDITYKECLEQKLKILDFQAMELLINSSIETRVFSMDDFSNFMRVISGDYSIGTTIKSN